MNLDKLYIFVAVFNHLYNGHGLEELYIFVAIFN